MTYSVAPNQLPIRGDKRSLRTMCGVVSNQLPIRGNAPLCAWCAARRSAAGTTTRRHTPTARCAVPSGMRRRMKSGLYPDAQCAALIQELKVHRSLAYPNAWCTATPNGTLRYSHEVRPPDTQCASALTVFGLWGRFGAPQTHNVQRPPRDPDIRPKKPSTSAARHRTSCIGASERKTTKTGTGPTPRVPAPVPARTGARSERYPVPNSTIHAHKPGS